jgi:putative isomerase
MTIHDDLAAIDAWVHAAYPDRLRPPVGQIAQPFIDPGTGYEDILWDWDAYFSLHGLARVAAADRRIGVHARGCVDAFLARQGPDGHIPYSIMAKGPAVVPAARAANDVRNTAKPLMAQFARMAHDYGGADTAWLAGHAPALGRFIEHWYATQGTTLGLLTWRSHRGSGADNHPSYFQRPHNSVACPYANSLMVLECRALAEIHRMIGGDPTPWIARADALADAIERHLWDPIDGAYYAVDLSRGEPGPVRTPVDWVVPLKFRSWLSAMPLYASIAAPERGARVVREHLLAPTVLRSPVGIRSLGRNEPAYRLFSNYNPSNWLGPVWVVSTAICYEALRRYAYHDEARALAADHLRMLAADYRAHGRLHEYYHPETGAGMMHPGFVNWNTCAHRLAGDLAAGI